MIADAQTVELALTLAEDAAVLAKALLDCAKPSPDDGFGVTWDGWAPWRELDNSFAAGRLLYQRSRPPESRNAAGWRWVRVKRVEVIEPQPPKLVMKLTKVE